MKRFEAIERPGGWTDAQGKVHPCYDLPATWKDGKSVGGVRWFAWLIVTSFEGGGGPYRIHVFGAGFPGASDTILFDSYSGAYAQPIKEGGNIAVVSLDDHPLEVFWELTAVKA